MKATPKNPGTRPVQLTSRSSEILPRAGPNHSQSTRRSFLTCHQAIRCCCTALLKTLRSPALRLARSWRGLFRRRSTPRLRLLNLRCPSKDLDMTQELARRLATIVALVERSSGKSLGRTAVMKLLYFLSALRGVQLGYRFTLYSYGPFDSEVLQ